VAVITIITIIKRNERMVCYLGNSVPNPPFLFETVISMKRSMYAGEMQMHGETVKNERRETRKRSQQL